MLPHLFVTSYEVAHLALVEGETQRNEWLKAVRNSFHPNLLVSAFQMKPMHCLLCKRHLSVNAEYNVRVT